MYTSNGSVIRDAHSSIPDPLLPTNPLKLNQLLPNICLFVSTVYTAVLLAIYATQRDAIVPLSYRTSFSGWGELRALMDTSERSAKPVTWEQFDAILWCPMGRSSSPQCGCLHDYYHKTYMTDVESVHAGNMTWVELGQKHAEGVVKSCLRLRPTWRKDECGDFCRVHLATPVILSCLYMSLFFSIRSHYSQVTLQLLAAWIPTILAVAVIVMQLYYDRTGGIVSALSVVSVLVEYFYIGPFVDFEQLFYCYQRFACSAFAVWVAITHQARDVYLVTAFGILGFSAGLAAYVTHLVRKGCPCKHDGSICQQNFLAIFVILAAFVLLIQQSYYTSSPMISSQVSPCILVVALLQCLDQTPYQKIGSVSFSAGLGVILLSIAFVATVLDLTT